MHHPRSMKCGTVGAGMAEFETIIGVMANQICLEPSLRKDVEPAAVLAVVQRDLIISLAAQQIGQVWRRVGPLSCAVNSI
jgi:hypothetical protein